MGVNLSTITFGQTESKSSSPKIFRKGTKTSRLINSSFKKYKKTPDMLQLREIGEDEITPPTKY